MSLESFSGGYPDFVRSLLAQHPEDVAMSLAVGGEAEAFGKLELEMLVQLGLRAEDYLIDVGCGSGRLALPASEYLTGRYLGLDVVDTLLDYARRRVNRPDWRFELVSRPEIPEADGAADWVTFFSVLTHLSPRDSYRYLREARRVLRPGGTIVASFLELDLHWKLFEDYVRVADEAAGEPGGIRVDFLDRETIRTFAEHLELEVAEFFRGNQRFIWLRSPTPIHLSGGRRIESPAVFGQSVCMLRVPS